MNDYQFAKLLTPTETQSCYTNRDHIHSQYYDSASLGDLQQKINNKDLFALHLNIRSLIKNKEALEQLLASFKVQPHVILLSETRILTSNTNCPIDISGYKFYFEIPTAHV